MGRTWREGDVHHFKEWNVFTMLESPMEKAFLFGDNTGMTATDTQKNTVMRMRMDACSRSNAARDHHTREPTCGSHARLSYFARFTYRVQVYVVAKRMSQRWVACSSTV